MDSFGLITQVTVLHKATKYKLCNDQFYLGKKSMKKLKLFPYFSLQMFHSSFPRHIKFAIKVSWVLNSTK